MCFFINKGLLIKYQLAIIINDDKPMVKHADANSLHYTEISLRSYVKKTLSKA